MSLDYLLPSITLILVHIRKKFISPSKKLEVGLLNSSKAAEVHRVDYSLLQILYELL